MLGLFAFESDGALGSRFFAVYEALVVLIWTNSVLGIYPAHQSINLKLTETPPSILIRNRNHFTGSPHAILVRSGDMGARHRLQPMPIPLSGFACLRFPVHRQVFSRSG